MILNERQALIEAAGWAKTSAIIVTDPKLSRNARQLYTTLELFSFGKRQVWPGQRRLGELLGGERNSVLRWTKELVDRGLLVVTRRGKNKTNYYHLPALDTVYGDKDVEAFCCSMGRDISRVRDYAGHLLSESVASSVMQPDASLMMQPVASSVMQEVDEDEEEEVEEEEALTPTPAAPTRDPARKPPGQPTPPPEKPKAAQKRIVSRVSEIEHPAAAVKKHRVRNPLAREVEGGDSEAASRIARKAAELAERTEREAGGFAARRGTSRAADGGFGKGFDRGTGPSAESHREAENDRKQTSPRGKRQADLEPPLDTSEFAPWAEFCTSLCRRPKAAGRGIKDPSEWNGADFEVYLTSMIQGWQEEEPPHVTTKTKAQAKRLVGAVGGDLAKDLLDFCLQNWAGVRNRLRLDTAAFPSAAIIEGYLESIKTLKKEGVAKVDVGINRVKATYDDQPDEGW